MVKPARTYALQETLPPLPLPSLSETLEKLVLWTEPLVDAPTHSQTKQRVNHFLKTDGPKLQKKLAEFAGKTDGNWMTPFAEARRTEYRKPIPLVLSYAFQVRESLFKGRNRFEKLAGISLGLASFYLKLCRENVEPEQLNGTPFCMSTYPYLLYTRIAGHKRDYMHLPPAGGTRYIAVMASDRFFLVPIIKNQEIYPGLKDLTGLFQQVYAEPGSPDFNYGAISLADRTDAAQLRDMLQQNPITRQAMSALEDSLFVINLDRGYQGQQAFWENILGGITNRFYDKSLQIVSSQDGKIGFCLEHMGSDATVWLRVLDHLVKFKPPVSGRGCPELKALRFEAFKPEKRKLEEIAARFKNTEGDIVLKRYEIKAFNRSALKSLGISPDAFCQIAFNTAHYLSLGKMCSTYESVAVRQFMEGRTEAGRPATSEILAYAKAFDSCNNCFELKKKLLHAANAHLEMIRCCKQGKGVQRHMTGLLNMYLVYREELSIREKPAIFNDPGFQELITDSISSSSIMHPALRHFGFGPQTNHGLGIGLGYMVMQDSLSMVIMAKTCNRERLERFCRHLVKVLERNAEILKTA